MYDLITIGDITMDLFFKGESLTTEKDRFHLALGGKYEAETFYESLGGGGANVASGASKLGLKTAVVGRIGDNPFRQLITQKLLRAHVSKDLLIDMDDYFNISTILLTKNGERTIVHYCSKVDEYEISTRFLDVAKNTQWAYIGNLPDMQFKKKHELIKFFKKHDVPVCLNIGRHDCKESPADIKKMLKDVDIFFLNTHEFADAVNKKHESIDFKKNQRKLLDFDGTVLLVTDGHDGSYGYTKDTVLYQKALEPDEITDTTGAGDAYISGFLAHYIRTSNIEESMKEAAAYACEVISRIGAQ